MHAGIRRQFAYHAATMSLHVLPYTVVGIVFMISVFGGQTISFLHVVLHAVAPTANSTVGVHPAMHVAGHGVEHGIHWSVYIQLHERLPTTTHRIDNEHEKQSCPSNASDCRCKGSTCSNKGR